MIPSSSLVVGANAERSRSHNRQVVLGRVRAAKGIGRAEIARASGLSTQAVSNIIADLLAEGLIVEGGRVASGRGLPAPQYCLNATGAFALGIEIRPDAVFAALLNLCGQTVTARRTALPAPDRDSVTETVTGLRDAVLAEACVPRDRLLGVGVVMPGPFGVTGIRGSGSDLAIWGDTPPATWLAEALEQPVIVENDANAAAIAERVSGAAQGLDSYAFIYFGSGLGLGVVQNGRLITGAHGNAGEIGHIPVPSGNGVVPLETVVSRLSVQRALAEVGIAAESGEDLDQLYQAGTPRLTAWLEDAAQPLSAAVSIVENLFDPAAVILGGAMPDRILDHLIGAVTPAGASVADRSDRALPRLLRGASGRMTATLGAAALVIEHAFTPKIAAQP